MAVAEALERETLTHTDVDDRAVDRTDDATQLRHPARQQTLHDRVAGRVLLLVLTGSRFRGARREPDRPSRLELGRSSVATRSGFADPGVTHGAAPHPAPAAALPAAPGPCGLRSVHCRSPSALASRLRRRRRLTISSPRSPSDTICTATTTRSTPSCRAGRVPISWPAIFERPIHASRTLPTKPIATPMPPNRWNGRAV